MTLSAEYRMIKAGLNVEKFTVFFEELQDELNDVCGLHLHLCHWNYKRQIDA